MGSPSRRVATAVWIALTFEGKYGRNVRRVKCTILPPGGLYVRRGGMSRWCMLVGLAEQIMYLVYRAGDLSDPVP